MHNTLTSSFTVVALSAVLGAAVAAFSASAVLSPTRERHSGRKKRCCRGFSRRLHRSVSSAGAFSCSTAVVQQNATKRVSKSLPTPSHRRGHQMAPSGSVAYVDDARVEEEFVALGEVVNGNGHVLCCPWAVLLVLCVLFHTRHLGH